jgi:hypothetical protein
MTTIKLKKVLIHRITEINDISFLKALNAILESHAKTEVISLTIEQKTK